MKPRIDVWVNPRVKSLRELAQMDVADIEDLTRKIDSAFKGHERRLFATEGGAAGEKWPPLSPGYARWKRKKYGAKKKIMNRTGVTRKSLTSSNFLHLAVYSLKPRASVTVGTRYTVPAYHIEGSPLKNPNVPHRDVMAHSPENEQKYMEIVARKWRQKLRRVAKIMAVWPKARGR